ncbi:leukemia inhibitory factor receptor isoform X1 [Poecilia reticulata]|uniref:leukemia inhibitory factor receptor isoform X1 n=1 Tax=Poecilia reticulata TaxID=8081 RepID=UPI0004A48F88|nr:PREDICTED: leukemia inhibitory factor receptor-like isoform X1 [Poecilia reticulata]
MGNLELFCAHLLGLYLIFSHPHTEGCGDFGSLPPKPNIRNFNANQSLVVSWPRNRGASESDVYEIQISRTKSRTIIYNRNVSVPTRDSGWSTLTWSSDLPLECVDHSVRIRSFCHQTAAGPWSNWVTIHGARAADESLMFPSGRILKEGSSATLCCVPPVGVNITGITLRKVSYPLLNIGDGVQAILMTNLTIPNTLIKRLFFSCVDSTGNSNVVENFISFPPQKPRNLNCTTSDMTSITCMWDPGRKRDQHDRNNQTHKLYIENTGQAHVCCQPPSCTFPAVPQQQEYNIRLKVEDHLGEETATYSFNISDRVSPVLELARVIPGVTDVSLIWTVEGNLTQNKLLCQVSAANDTNRELPCSSEDGLCKVRLDGLRPNRTYSAKVRCSINGRLWGQWTEPVSFTTLVTLDLWRRIESKPDSDIRNVTLLWKPPATATPVKIQSYAVQWSQEGQTVAELKDSGQSQAVVLIGPSRCNFTVQAVLSTGSSISARIIIPAKDDSEIPPVKKRLNRTADGFHLWWNEQTSVTCGHTVEWCIMGSKEPCTLQWMKVPKGNNTFLPAGYFKPELRYSFDIYGCTDHGDKLLETQTGYIQESRYVEPPRIIQPVKRTYASVTLEWHYDEDDPGQRAFITGYLVTVQEVQTDTSLGHAATLFNVSVSNPRQKSVTMEGLQQDQEYVCSVRALTTVGPGSTASITIRTKVNNFSHLAKILTPILLLLGCTVLLWPQRKMLKNGLREIFTYPAGMNIKTPEFESFLNETGQKLQSQREEECISCDIEVLTVKPFWHESSILTDPDGTNTTCSPSPQSSLPPSCPLQTGYRPQSAVLLCQTPAHQQLRCIANKSYLSPITEFSEIRSSFESSDCLQGSCAGLYGYISDS